MFPPSPQCSVPARYARLHYALGGGGKETKPTTNILLKVPNLFQDLTARRSARSRICSATWMWRRRKFTRTNGPTGIGGAQPAGFVGDRVSSFGTHRWGSSCISQTDYRSWGDTWESHGRVAGHTWETPGGYLGATPASAGPRNISRAYGRWAEGAFPAFEVPAAG